MPVKASSDWPFQIVNEGEACKLWDQYLIFAQLFGIAGHVATQLNKLYPNNSNQNDLRYNGGSLYLASIAISNTYTQTIQRVFGSADGGIGGISRGVGGGGR